MKIKILVLSIFVLFTAGLVTAQETKPAFLNKTNQHSISAEFAAISYSYAHKFKPNVTFGARVQVGYGMTYFLTNPTIIFDFGYGNGSEEVKIGGFGEYGSLDILKLQLFYRRVLSSHFYAEIGPYSSWTFGEADWSNPLSVGVETSVYYLIKRINIGFRIQGSWSIGQQYKEQTFFALYITPIVIGINF